MTLNDAVLLLISVLLGIGAYVYKQLEKRVSELEKENKLAADARAANAATLSEIKTDLKHVMDEIGDHDTGIRGNLHKLRGEWSPVLIRIQSFLEKH